LNGNVGVFYVGLSFRLAGGDIDKVTKRIKQAEQKNKKNNMNNNKIS